MIYSTHNQLNCFFIFTFLGIIFSVIYNCLKILFLHKNSKNFKKITINCIFYSIFSIIFVILLNIFNFGLFSIVLLCATVLGFVWLNFTSKKLVVFLEVLWYNKHTKDKTEHARKEN